MKYVKWLAFGLSATLTALCIHYYWSMIIVLLMAWPILLFDVLLAVMHWLGAPY